MTKKSDQFVEAVSKLLELTQEGKLLWESDLSPGRRGLVAFHKGQRLRLQKLSGGSRRYYNEPPSADVALEFVDDIGNPIFAFPEVEGLEDLYDAASYQASGVKDFLRDLLDE